MDNTYLCVVCDLGKSLPVHCVVEAICSIEEPRGNHTGQWRRRPVVETDSFVIIPINTPFQDLVQAALHRLGYPNDSVAAAKGKHKTNQLSLTCHKLHINNHTIKPNKILQIFNMPS